MGNRAVFPYILIDIDSFERSDTLGVPISLRMTLIGQQSGRFYVLTDIDSFVGALWNSGCVSSFVFRSARRLVNLRSRRRSRIRDGRSRWLCWA